MSEGLKLISAVIAAGSISTLGTIDVEEMLDTERDAYSFVRQHLRTYRELPTAQTLQEELGIRLPVASEPLQYYVNQVHDRHDYNLVRDRFSELREALSTRNMPTVEASVSSMSRIIRRRRSPTSAGETVNIRDGLARVVERLHTIRGTGGISGVTTGWHRFDAATGGYQDADLITFVGRPSVGKTYVMLRQAHRAHHDGFSVLFITTEMGIEAISRRYAAVALGVNPTNLRTGNVSSYTSQRVRRLQLNMEGADRFNVVSVGMQAKADSLGMLLEELRPDIAYIDGVYLLRPTDAPRNANRTEKVTAVFDELKAMNLQADIPFVLSTQFSRLAGKAGKEGTLENIGYSDAIGTHSSVVVAIKPGTGENPAACRVLEFLKGREGESGEYPIHFQFAPLNMEEMDQYATEDESEPEVVSEEVQWMGIRRR